MKRETQLPSKSSDYVGQGGPGVKGERGSVQGAPVEGEAQQGLERGTRVQIKTK